MTYKGFEIIPASPTGGKAGRGCNKTSSLQVFKVGGNSILKQFRFNVSDGLSIKRATAKAMLFADNAQLTGRQS
jgi:hypothetical protein